MQPLPPTPYPLPPRRSRRSRGGFTLIEAALTTVIVGTGVLAIVAAQQAYHQKNDWAQRTGTAFLLANEIRELMMPMPLYDPISGDSHLGPELNEPDIEDYDDVDDFAGTVDVGGVGAGMTINPPINAMCRTLDDMDQWTQRITVAGVSSANISVAEANVGGIGTTDMVRVKVEVLYQGPNDPQPMLITDLSWVIPDN